ncbi:PfkB domain protein [Actinobacteria bacterium OK074]|nr:PfkB domain protein [Actinobacteria bacterium OK074]
MAEVRLVIVGHVGFGVDRTPKGISRHLGGSGYACARGATVVDPERTGLVARVGEDFDRSTLKRLGVDLRGIKTVDGGTSARFEIFQYADNSRSVTSRLAVADHPDAWPLPPDYERAQHVHLATMPLEQQRAWLLRARAMPSRPRVSVDMFESNAEADPVAARWLCHAADLVFMNEEEEKILFSDQPLPSSELVDLVVKRGGRGASYVVGRREYESEAPGVEAVDTTGAGEILAGALLSLLLAGYSKETALRHATAVASAKVGEFGVDGGEFSAALQAAQRAVTGSRSRTPRHRLAAGVAGAAATTARSATTAARSAATPRSTAATRSTTVSGRG